MDRPGQEGDGETSTRGVGWGGVGWGGVRGDTCSSYLHDKGEGGREEGHEDNVVSNNGHGSEPAHNLQPPGT